MFLPQGAKYLSPQLASFLLRRSIAATRNKQTLFKMNTRPYAFSFARVIAIPAVAG
jgi:hypothetical protein